MAGLGLLFLLALLSLAFFALPQSAAPARAETIKPPVRGLISMGAYKFVGAGGQPVNTLEPIRQFSGVFGGLVVVASWEQLQPVAHGPLVENNVIDQTLAQIRIYNQNHPNRPLSVKLRVWGGFMAPDWAKEIGGAPIAATHNGHARTLGRFWSPAYRAAFANLQKLLAAKYDGEPLIREVAITQCMSFTAEPFFIPNRQGGNVVPILQKAGFTDEAFKSCLTNAVADYAPWKETRLVYSFNPYNTAQGGGGDPQFTIGVMKACRAAVGVRCVLDNHDLDATPPKAILPIFAAMKELGPEIEFQTFTTTPKDFPGTIKLGVQLGASGIELYQDYPGFTKVPPATLKEWAGWVEGNTGAAK